MVGAESSLQGLFLDREPSHNPETLTCTETRLNDGGATACGRSSWAGTLDRKAIMPPSVFLTHSITRIGSVCVGAAVTVPAVRYQGCRRHRIPRYPSPTSPGFCECGLTDGLPGDFDIFGLPEVFGSFAILRYVDVEKLLLICLGSSGP